MSQYITFSFATRFVSDLMENQKRGQNCFCNKSQIFYYQQANGEMAERNVFEALEVVIERRSEELFLFPPTGNLTALYWRTRKGRMKKKYPQKLQHVTTTTAVVREQKRRVVSLILTHLLRT